MKSCVASGSSLEYIRRGLQLTGLLDFFEPHILSASMVRTGKPAPDLFLYAEEQMGVAPEHCLVIEDSSAGIKAQCSRYVRVLVTRRKSYRSEETAA